MASMASVETQVQSAKRMYDARAANYEDSWHPNYSKRFIELSPLQPGQRVLDLCCGTGLDAFLAAAIVGESGEVICVDASDGMLAVAREKLVNDSTLGPRMQFIKHDVKDLSGIAQVEKESFDAILCSNAFVLFDDARAVLRVWREYLKPGGFLVVDIPHERNMRSGVFLETAVKRLGVKHFPSNRVWITSKDSFRHVLEAEHFTVDVVTELQKVTDQRSTYFSIEEADAQFDYISNCSMTLPLMQGDPPFEEAARKAFKEAFEKAAVDGKVEIVDALYVYLARKA